jgi:hypothetical protein
MLSIASGIPGRCEQGCWSMWTRGGPTPSVAYARDRIG